MMERKLFEQKFPVPTGIHWNEASEQYDALPGAAGFDDVEIYHGRWEAWQAARAQGGEVEPVAELFTDEYGDEQVHWLTGRIFSDGTEFYTAPPAPTQGVPESVEALVRQAEQACQDDGEQTLRESRIAQQWLESLNQAINLLSTTTGNGEWVRCEDRVHEKCGGRVIGRMRDGECVTCEDCGKTGHVLIDDGGIDIEWLPTGLKRPQPPVQGGERWKS